MRRTLVCGPLLFLLAGLALPSLVPAQKKKGKAPLFQGMGSHHHPVTTRSKLAQRYFDQGLAPACGFNHAEAGRSFLEAAIPQSLGPRGHHLDLVPFLRSAAARFEVP